LLAIIKSTPLAATLLLLLTPWLSACVSLSPQQQKQVQGFRSDITVSEVPFYPQREDLCGPTALASMLGKSGRHVEPEWLERQVYLPGRHGSLRQEMLAAARSYARIDYVIEPRLDALLSELQAGHAVLVLQNLGLSWYPRWHYAVVTGYRADAGTDSRSIVMHTGWDAEREVTLETFAKTWERSGNWAAVILAPGDFPADDQPLRYLQALLRLQLSMPGQKPVSDAYQSALTQWPQFLPLRLAQANWLQQLGQIQQAEQALKQLLQIAPGYAPANNNLALLLLHKGQAIDALGYSKQALQHADERFRQHYLDTQAQIEAALGH